jgi:AmmeMemoRadiSam system protein B
MTIVNKRTAVIIVLAAALATVSSALIFSGAKTPLTPTSLRLRGTSHFTSSATRGEVGNKHLATLMSPAFYDEAYKNAPPVVAAPSDTAGGIVNHHLLAAPLLAQFFEGLKNQKIKHLVLIGPDHLSRGSEPITISAETWGTPYGDLRPNTALIDQLSNESLAHIEEWPFDYEFSVGGLVTFAKRSLPDADVATIILRGDASNEALAKLAATLPRSSDTLVVASLDFSHYLTSDAADFHDLTSRAVISDFEINNFDKIEIDSLPSLRVALQYFQLRNALSDTLIASTNSAKITGKLDAPSTTSYMNQYFSAGAKTPFAVKTSLYLAGNKTIVSDEDRFMRGFMSFDNGSTLPAAIKKPNLAVGFAQYPGKTVYYLFPIAHDKTGARLMTAAEEKAYFRQNNIKESIVTDNH